MGQTIDGSAAVVRSESDLARLLRQHTDVLTHLSFVESHASARGIPDVSYTINGVTGWLELKYGTLARPPSFRVSQRQWFKYDVLAGGMPLVLLASNRGAGVRYGLIGGHKYEAIYACTTLGQWEALCDVSSADFGAVFGFLIGLLSRGHTQT